MAEVKLRALGLREVNFGDYDRYLTALTKDGRKIEIFCKGVRRDKCEKPAARQLCWSEFILSERGGRHSLRDADLVHSFFGLTRDIEKYALACYLSELAAGLTDSDTDAPIICQMLLHALYSLETGKREAPLVKAAFEWRLMVESGYAPDFSVCGVCGQKIERPPVYFSIPAGQAAHVRCAERVGGWIRMPDAALKAVYHAGTSEPSKAYAFSLTGPARECFCDLAEKYVQYHLDRGFDSLDFYKSVLAPI